jgi:hypothetical protein
MKKSALNLDAVFTSVAAGRVWSPARFLIVTSCSTMLL